ncbi:MAG: deaminase, partial [Isosphaeraceae bacterium]
MRLALALAREGQALGEVPVGAVVARDGRVIAQAFNLRETTHDPTAHAERLALTMAGRMLGTWRLDRCTI